MTLTNLQNYKKYILNRTLGLQFKNHSPQKAKKSIQKSICSSQYKIKNKHKQRSQDFKIKQWPLYNLINLNKIELYQTNLKLSCQGWITIDYSEMKYLRGWNCKQKSQFVICMKLFVAQIVLRLQEQKIINIYTCSVQINHKIARNALVPKNHDKFSKDDKYLHLFSLKDRTSLLASDLLIGMLISNKIDTVWYMMYLIGYWLDCKRMKSQNNNLMDQYIKLSEPNKMDYYLEIVTHQMNIICKQLSMQQTQINTHRNYISIESTALDVSLIFMSVLKWKIAKKIYLQLMGQYTHRISYPVGWKYYENRTHRWQNPYHKMLNLGMSGVYAENINNQCAVMMDPKINLIMILVDSKSNLSVNDAKKLRKWCMQTFKRLSPQKKNVQKYCKECNKCVKCSTCRNCYQMK